MADNPGKPDTESIVTLTARGNGSFGAPGLKVFTFHCVWPQADVIVLAVLELGAAWCPALVFRLPRIADTNSQLTRCEGIPMPRVRDAVRNALSPGDRLFTPTRKPFLVEALGADEISLRAGPDTESRIRIEFDALDALPDDMARYRDEVPIGPIEGDSAQGTLEDSCGTGTLTGR